jgi:hypothetical protein
MQVLGRLRFDKQLLRRIFAGGNAMLTIESPIYDDLRAEVRQGDILRVLQARFKYVPEELRQRLQAIEDLDHLGEMIAEAACCPSLEAFGQFVALKPQS